MAEHGHTNYVKIWAWLVVLLIISIIGPMFEIQALTLVTAFGIALVKAYLVCKNFMHLNVEPKFILYILGTCLAFMALFYAGTSPDVMAAEGANWVKPSFVEALTVKHEPSAH